jgi:hypothetical protein
VPSGGVSSGANERTKPWIACFEATYTGQGKKGHWPATLVICITAKGPGFLSERKWDMAS